MPAGPPSPIIADDWNDVPVPLLSQLKSPFSSMLFQGWRSVELQSRLLPLLITGRLIGRSDSGLQKERSLFLPQKLAPFKWIQMEMSASWSGAWGCAAQHCFPLRKKRKKKKKHQLRRIEPFPPLCK